MRILRALALTSALILATALNAETLTAQSIGGRITSSADGAPIMGAEIVLLDGGGVNVLGTTTSGMGGVYRLDTPGPGVYLLVVNREGFANQVSSPITVAVDPVDFDLSMTEQRVGETGAVADDLDDATLLSMAIAEVCEGIFVPGLHAILFGAVRNQADSEPLAFVEVQARWTVEGMGSDSRRVRSDDAGAYLICDAPASTELTLQAVESETDVEGGEQRMTLSAGTMRKVDLGIPLSNPNQGGNILGQVTDEGGTGIVGASVRLLGADRIATTNNRGIFFFDDVPSGVEIVEAEGLGYAVQRESVRILGGRAQEISIRLSVDPIDLAPILVSVRPRKWFIDRRDLEQRILLGTGYIMMREDIEERAPQVLGEALRGIPGVQVTRLGGGMSGVYEIQFRGAANLANQACNPVVWVDGVRLGNDGSIFREIQAFEIEVLEVYRGPAEVPAEFAGGEARCGVVSVWTRRGGRLIG